VKADKSEIESTGNEEILEGGKLDSRYVEWK